jgi:hypothetical protein
MLVCVSGPVTRVWLAAAVATEPFLVWLAPESGVAFDAKQPGAFLQAAPQQVDMKRHAVLEG